jgi:hypothetical protein
VSETRPRYPRAVPDVDVVEAELLDDDPRAPAPARDVDDDDELGPPRIAPLDRRKLDAIYKNARAVTEPLIEIAYLATATVSAVRIAWKRAERRARQRQRQQTPKG